MQKRLISIVRIILLMCISGILFDLTFVDKTQLVHLNDWILYGFKSIYVVAPDGSLIFSFVKFLTALSLLLLLEMDSIFYASDFADGFNQVVQNHSTSKIGYVRNTVNISNKYFLVDVIFWSSIFIFPLVFAYDIFVIDIYDIVSMMIFLALNYVVSNWIVIFSKNSVEVLVLYVFKMFLYAIFSGNEIYLCIILMILIMLYLFTNIKMGVK